MGYTPPSCCRSSAASPASDIVAVTSGNSAKVKESKHPPASSRRFRFNLFKKKHTDLPIVMEEAAHATKDIEVIEAEERLDTPMFNKNVGKEREMMTTA